MPMEKTFDATEAEARIYAMWEAMGAFRAGANASRAETFTIMIPPPNVTGSLHVGHAFNNTLQDVLVRWKRMQGYDVLWQPGTDHAGIATQLVVERQLAKAGNESRAEMGREKFLERVWEWKAESGGNIRNQLKRLGASCDWDREAFTMDANFHDAVIKVFVDMYNKGLIYRGKRLVNWDPHFETAISDLEVENVEVAGQMWHFKYLLAEGATYIYVEKNQDGRVTLSEERNYISIATTRPETMLGDGAVAVHPSDERYAPIVGKMVEIPIANDDGSFRQIKIIHDDYPDPTFGSGAVKITGAHDFNDHEVARRHGLTMHILMDTKGNMVSHDAPDNIVPTRYRGLHRFIKDGIPGARELAIAEINARGRAVTRRSGFTPTPADDIADTGGVNPALQVPYVEDKPIMQPFGDRSKVVIEPMLTDQWFVDTAKIVGPALDAVRQGRTRIIPESGEKTYYHWLENIEPWCISRQLWWGHQIPVWYGPTPQDGYDFNRDYDLTSNYKYAFCGATFEEAAKSAELRYGPRVFEVSSKEEAEAFRGFEVPLYRDPDVLDTWFSSGLWPIGTLGWPNWTEDTKKYFPTDVLITGSDILFFWVARMMMMQLAVVEQEPFHTVYLHQLVRDEKGEKMSKTRGNVIDPLDIVDQYGADALRFTMTQMAAIGGVLKLSEDRIKGYRNFGTKLWNAHRFAEMNGVFDGPRPTEPPHPTQTVNNWIIGETSKTLAEVNEALTTYRFNDAANALYAFVWGKVCDWYVEFSKPLLQGDDTTHKPETQQTMAWVLDQCLILLHPIMPFITEELWGQTDRPKPLIHTDWPTYSDLTDPKAHQEMTWAIAMIDNIRSARAQMNVPAGLYVPVLQLNADMAAQNAWAKNETLIKRLARIESLTPTTTVPKGAITVATPGATFAIPLAGIIDIAAEMARLTKAHEKLTKEINGLRNRLNNPNFATSAPPEVVAEAQTNLTARQDEAAQLTGAMARLAELG